MKNQILKLEQEQKKLKKSEADLQAKLTQAKKTQPVTQTSSENDKTNIEALKKKIATLEESKRVLESDKAKLKKAAAENPDQELERTIVNLKEKMRSLEKQLKSSVDTNTLLMNKMHAKDHQMKQLQISHRSENEQFTKRISELTKTMKAKIEDDLRMNETDMELSRDSLEKIESARQLLKNWKIMM